ncbi:MAG TPA: cytochrome c peroxidase [Gemmatimonadales bacterium]|nr:cytochrome c peroxidase [Gemmatimonadales bacterium]
MTRAALLRPWLAALALMACSSESKNAPRDIDDELTSLLGAANVTPLEPPPAPLPAQVTLGRFLMFDKILSGNRNISCATCHHPTLVTGDGLPLSVGEGSTGLGETRIGGGGGFIPRSAPDLLNRGFPQWQVMFWEGRVQAAQGGGFHTPAGASLPSGLSGVLAAQAMFPVTVREEMRGVPADSASGNELARIPNDSFPQIWNGLMERLRAIPQYDTLFQAAFGISVNAAGFQHVANALAAFQTAAFTRINTPYDAYVAGDRTALSEPQKRGARLFFGKANCSKCHLGPLLTDQRFHNVLSPQLGPGRGALAPLDNGRAEVTGLEADRFLFRTPPLRNVAMTAPYFHNGAFATLEAAVRHYINVGRSLRDYNANQLPAALQPTVHDGDAVWSQLQATIDPNVADTLTLSNGEVNDLIAFLGALTDPSVASLANQIPASVPSGLPVSD